MKRTKRLGTYGMALALASVPALGMEIDGLAGEVLVDTRIRYESADAANLESSHAETGRLRIGYKSTDINGFSFFAEAEATMVLQGNTYDAYPGGQGTAGKTVIADPENFELNRIQLDWKSEQVDLSLGRQRIIRNNARFIGNVGWRQNEQTYDAVAVGYRPDETFSVYYAYLDRAQRIFGKEADSQIQREFDMSSHVLEAQYNPTKTVAAGLYAYLLGIENSPGVASDTVGIWTSGSRPLGDDDFSFVWRGEYAQQFDNSKSPTSSNFNLMYTHLSGGFKMSGAGTVTVGYESLEGNGTRGFSTPLATLHAHNGFADMFLSTPASGLTDLYLKVSAPIGDSVKAALIIHKFEAESGSITYGEEVDFVLGWKIDANLSVTGKLAVFEGDAKPDVTKFWLQLDAKY